jgi:NADPH:quinone reductase-like Zn-dependent oxidoreductase
MRAVTIHKHGGPEELRLEEMPAPEAEDGKVLIKLKAAALNHLDLWVRKGIPGLKLKFPHIMGSDGSGVVEETGSGVKGIASGDSVLLDPGISCGVCEFCAKGEHSECVTFHLIGEHIDGTHADYVLAPQENVHPIPSHLSFEEAAALPLVFLTAWRMLFTRAGLRAGEDLLVIGVGGGVSNAAFHLGTAIGARVTVTSGDQKKVEKALEMGAYHAFNHKEQDFVTEVRKITDRRGVDVCLDSVGDATWRKSLQSLAKGGRLVTCGATTGPNPSTDIQRIFWNQLTIMGSTMGSRNDVLEMLRFVTDKGLKPVIDSTYPLEEARAAQEKMEKGEQFGKIVIKIGEE